MSASSARRRCAVLATGFVLCASRASAQQSPADRARDLAERGLTARQLREDAAALALFEQSYAIVPRVSVRAQIAFAQQALGRWVEAERTLTEVVTSDDPFVVRHRSTIDEALTTVRAHLGWLSVTVTPADAALSANGQPLNTGATIRFAVGSVVVQATHPRYFPVERTVTITAGETARETIELNPRPPVSSGTPPHTVARVETPSVWVPRREDSARSVRSDRSFARFVGPSAVAASGAVVLGVGVGLWFVREGALRALSSRGCVETQSEWLCDPSAIDPSRAREEHQLATTSSALSVATIALGSAAIAGSAVWFAIEATRPPRARTTVRVGPGFVRWVF